MKNNMVKHSDWIQVLSIFGFLFMAIVMVIGQDFTPYLIETGAMILLFQYGRGHYKGRTFLLALSAFLAVVYAFFNFSPLDLVYWFLAFCLVM